MHNWQDTAYTLRSDRQSSHLLCSACCSWLPLSFSLEDRRPGYIFDSTLGVGPMPAGGHSTDRHTDAEEQVRTHNCWLLLVYWWSEQIYYLSQRSFSELTCWPCVRLCEGIVCICASGCRSWSNPPSLELSHMGGLEGHSGHRTDSVSRLKGGRKKKLNGMH